MKRVTLVPYWAMWKPEMVKDAGCYEKFARKHILEEQAEDEQSRPERVLAKSIYYYLKNDNESFVSCYKGTPLERLTKRLYRWKKRISVLETLYDNDLMCTPHIVYQDGVRCVVLMLKDREEREIQERDLIELLIPVYLLYREAKRRGIKRKYYYIGIVAIRSERPLYIQRVPSDMLENLNKYIVEKVRGAILSLLDRDGKYNDEVCKDCGYVSSCSRRNKGD